MSIVLQLLRQKNIVDYFADKLRGDIEYELYKYYKPPLSKELLFNINMMVPELFYGEFLKSIGQQTRTIFRKVKVLDKKEWDIVKIINELNDLIFPNLNFGNRFLNILTASLTLSTR